MPDSTTTHLEEFLVQSSTSIKLSQLNFHLDVLDKEFRLGAHSDGGTKDLSSGNDVEPSDLERGVCGPELGKGELFMRDQLDCRLVDVSSALVIVGVDLLESGVLQPDCARES